MLLIEKGIDYHTAFTEIFTSNPLTSHLYYGSYSVELNAPDLLKDFNIDSTLTTAKIAAFRNTGKSVYDPSRVESIWVHRPHFINRDYIQMEMPLEKGFFFHMRKWNIDGKVDQTRMVYDIMKMNPVYPFIWKILPREKLDYIVNNAYTRIDNILDDPELANITSTNFYYNQIDYCVAKFTGKYAEVDGCRTPYACRVDPIPGFRCVESVQSFSKHFMDDNFMIFIPDSSPRPKMLHNGCRV